MATTTLQVMRRELSASLGYSDKVGLAGAAWTTTTNITTNQLVISTEVPGAGFDDWGDAASGDDIFQGHWLLLLDDADGSTSSNTGVERLVKSYDASLGQFTVLGSALAAENESTDFEVHRYRPTLLRELLNSARLLAFPSLHMPVTRSLFTARGQVRYEVPSAIIGEPVAIWLERGLTSDFANSILTDGAFEVWTNATTLTNWAGTTLDVTQEEQAASPKNYAVLRGGYSARCTSQTTNTGTLLQTISSPGTHSGQRISLSVWVYCLTASVVSTQITVNGTINLGSAADGGLHTGTGWELLTHYEDTTVTISTLTVGISVLSTATDNTEFYVDEAICVVGPPQEPEMLGVELHRWTYVPQTQGVTARNEVVFPWTFPDNHRLRFEGRGYLSSVSAETDTMEIGKPQNDLLYAYATAELYRRLQHQSSDVDRDWLARMESHAQRDIQRLVIHSVRGQPRKLQVPNWG